MLLGIKMGKAQSNRKSHHRTCRFRKIDKKGIRVVFEVTHKCNLACTHCFVDRENTHPQLNDLLPVLKQLNAINCKKIIITGGEPLVRNDLAQIIEVCANQGILVDLNTNLFQINAEQARSLVAAGLNEVSVSIYGNEKVHDNMVGIKGAFQKTIYNIKMMRELNLKIDVHTPVYSENISSLEQIFYLCNSFACSSLTFFTIIQDVKSSNCKKKYNIDRKAALTIIRNLSNQYKVPTNTIGLIEHQREECTMCEEIIGITAKLELKPCLLATPTTKKTYNIKNNLASSLEALRDDVKQCNWKINCIS